MRLRFEVNKSRLEGDLLASFPFFEKRRELSKRKEAAGQ